MIPRESSVTSMDPQQLGSVPWPCDRLATIQRPAAGHAIGALSGNPVTQT